MHYLSPLLRKLLGGGYKALHSPERKRDTWISNRGARSFCSVKKRNKKKNVRNKQRERGHGDRDPRVCAFSRQKIVVFDRSFSQRLILFVRAAPSGTALSFIRKQENGAPVLLNNYYIPACPAYNAFTRTSSHSWVRSVVRAMIDRY